jgi:hypothetical protein
MDEKEKRCYLASFDGEREAERNPVNYQRRDDAHHIYLCDGYYEWWYNDCSFDNGYHMVLTYHYRNGFLKPIIPTTQVMLYHPDGKQTSRFAAWKPADIYAGPDWCDVRMGDSWIRDQGNGIYELFMKIGGVGARLTMKSVVPGWKLGSGFLYRNEATGLVAGWVVPVPHARVEGELFLKGETLPVTGTAYHDHNWGNERFHRFFSSWYWGRIHNDRYTLDYAWVLPRDQEAPICSPLMIAREGEIILSTNNMDARLTDIVKDPATPPEYARGMVFTTDNVGVKMNLVIQTKRVVDRMQMPKSADWDQYYYRFLADYQMDIEVDGAKDVVAGEMLHEYMVL